MDTNETSYGLTAVELNLCALPLPSLDPPKKHKFYVHHGSLFPKEILEIKQELLQTLELVKMSFMSTGNIDSMKIDREVNHT